MVRLDVLLHETGENKMIAENSGNSRPNEKPASSTQTVSMEPLCMIEVQDGLLVSENKVMMKARCPELFPANIQAYFQDKEKISSQNIDFGIHKVRVITESRWAVYDPKLIGYVKSLGKIEYYLSNVKLPCDEGEYYALFAKYKYGWCVVAPLEG